MPLRNQAISGPGIELARHSTSSSPPAFMNCCSLVLSNEMRFSRPSSTLTCSARPLCTPSHV
ncbi:hypothetical protein BpHYR1_036061 [Brachionus plicatilis]|uniref:Uncharacterized protein n=1 Tax=Brachionus plicatilis TaxID=10195 RepID=A0A3M7RZK2_BRAPC|nr:hypothetical protein BpHYR1_036061 [Brachionus plicatilis]